MSLNATKIGIIYVMLICGCQQTPKSRELLAARSYAMLCGERIALALKASDYNSIPDKSKAGIATIDRCVARDYFPTGFREQYKEVKTGFVKDDNQQDKFLFVVVWWNENERTWMRATVLVASTSKILSNQVERVDVNWIGDNLVEFPAYGSETYSKYFSVK